MHRPWKNGIELLDESLLYKRTLPTGYCGVDSLLGGGLRQGQLIELVGPSASGKTQQLACSLENQVITDEDKIHLLVVDSLSSLITPILGGRNSNGRSLMIIVGFLLKKLAHEHSISVLVTNHMVGGEGGTQKPALGESWKYIPHVRLML